MEPAARRPAARRRDHDPAMIARAIAAPHSRHTSDRIDRGSPSSNVQGGRARQAARCPSSACRITVRAARTTPRPRCRRARARCRHRLPLHGDLDVPEHRRPSARWAGGRAWIGQAPVHQHPHVFQNLGDGTYIHSGILAIRAAVAASVNITHKILYNDAVMTGGQPDRRHAVGVDHRARCSPRGVGTVVVVTDDRASTPKPICRTAWRCATAMNSTRCSASLRERRASPPDLRPDLRRREAAPPQARQVPRPGPARGHQRPGCEGCGDLRATSRTACRWPKSKPSSAASASSTSPVQQGLFLREGLLPELRHRRGRQASKRGRRAARAPRLATLPDADRWPTPPSPGASSSPASAAPAW